MNISAKGKDVIRDLADLHDLYTFLLLPPPSPSHTLRLIISACIFTRATIRAIHQRKCMPKRMCVAHNSALRRRKPMGCCSSYDSASWHFLSSVISLQYHRARIDDFDLHYHRNSYMISNQSLSQKLRALSRLWYRYITRTFAIQRYGISIGFTVNLSFTRWSVTNRYAVFVTVETISHWNRDR